MLFRSGRLAVAVAAASLIGVAGLPAAAAPAAQDPVAAAIDLAYDAAAKRRAAEQHLERTRVELGRAEHRLAESTAALEARRIDERAAAARLLAASSAARKVAVDAYLSATGPSIELPEDFTDAAERSRAQALLEAVADARLAVMAEYSAAKEAVDGEIRAVAETHAVATRDRAGAAAAFDDAVAALDAARLAEAEANTRVALAQRRARRTGGVITVTSPGGAGAAVPVLDGTDLPDIALRAYVNAAEAMQVMAPACGIGWFQIAGIVKVESNHGRFRGARADGAGRVTPRIIGIALDGTRGTMVIRDSEGGVMDGDAEFDRAVGPMQFIPTTWARYAADGNGDGLADPHNLFDAALATATYLCRNGGQMSTAEGARRGVFAYNRSSAYVAAVLAWARTYEAQQTSG